MTVVMFDTLRLMGSPLKSQRKVVQKDRWLFEGDNSIGLCPRIVLRKRVICGKLEKLGSNHAVKFSKTTMRRATNRERKFPSQGVKPKCLLQERIPWAPTF